MVNEDINHNQNEQLETMFVTQSITTRFAHKDRVLNFGFGKLSLFVQIGCNENIFINKVERFQSKVQLVYFVFRTNILYCSLMARVLLGAKIK